MLSARIAIPLVAVACLACAALLFPAETRSTWQSLGQLTGLASADADPGNGPAHHNLANVLLMDLDFDKALVHAQRAVAVQPDDPGSRELLRRILLNYPRPAELRRAPR